MWVLEAGENTTYNICDENLMNPQFGKMLHNPEVIHPQNLSENLRKKVAYFL